MQDASAYVPRHAADVAECPGVIQVGKCPLAVTGIVSLFTWMLLVCVRSSLHLGERSEQAVVGGAWSGTVIYERAVMRRDACGW